MKVGPYSVVAIEAETFALDGGAMFGVVPKTLWSRHHPADDRNRIGLTSRCLLVMGAGRIVLIDTGMGQVWSDEERDIYRIGDGGRSLAGALAARGVEPGEVTDVILTHLHFDHAGGTVTRDEGGALRPAFPRARHHVQESHLRWALSPSPRDRRSFRRETFAPLMDEELLFPVDGGAEILDGIFVEPTRGHTVGHQVVRVGEGEGAVVYAGDLIPTAAHLPDPWNMSYDLEPLRTIEEKRALLALAAERRWAIVFDHDPARAAVRVARHGEAFAVDGPVGME